MRPTDKNPRTLPGLATAQRANWGVASSHGGGVGDEKGMADNRRNPETLALRLHRWGRPAPPHVAWQQDAWLAETQEQNINLLKSLGVVGGGGQDRGLQWPTCWASVLPPQLNLAQENQADPHQGSWRPAWKPLGPSWFLPFLLASPHLSQPLRGSHLVSGFSSLPCLLPPLGGGVG